MTAELRISPRERLILTAILEMYIATGEPVASQAVARIYADKEGMSSATIRNVMVSLSDSGLLEQPHTSAGRIPTAKAFRFYVEHLAGAARAATGSRMHRSFRRRSARQIDDCFAGVTSRQHFLERTSHVLAMISSGVGVATEAAGETEWLEHIHFSRLTAQRVLAVVVTRRRHGAGPGAATGSRPGPGRPGGGGEFCERQFPWLVDRPHPRRTLSSAWSRSAVSTTG